MCIVFVVPRFYPYPGGYENYVLALVRSLKSSGHAITVVTTTAFDLDYFWNDGPRSLPAGHQPHDGIEIYRFPICHRRWLRRAGPSAGTSTPMETQSTSCPAQFSGNRVTGRTAKKTRGPASRWASSLQPPQVRGDSRSTPPGYPSGFHSLQPLWGRPNGEISRQYTRKFQITLLNQCDFVLALTEVERQRLIDLGLSPHRTVVTGNGIDPVELSGGNSRAFRTKYGVQGSIVLHLGMKAPDKGSTCVVDSMKRLWREGSQAWLVLAGPNSLSFDGYLAAPDSKFDRLLNLDTVTDQEKRDLLAAASMVVQPSGVESFGLVYLKAWANAKPVIAADTAVMRELIESGRDGLLVPFGEDKLLALAIQQLLDNREEREAMGLQGQKKCLNQFTWDAILERIHPYFAEE